MSQLAPPGWDRLCYLTEFSTILGENGAPKVDKKEGIEHAGTDARQLPQQQPTALNCQAVFAESIC